MRRFARGGKYFRYSIFNPKGEISPIPSKTTQNVFFFFVFVFFVHLTYEFYID
jgi:hypothetical protein